MRKTKETVIILVSLIVLLCSGCKEHNRELEKVINTIDQNFNKINNYIADYTIEEGNNLIFIGKITFVKPDITRFEILDPQTKKVQNIVFSDSNFKYSYFPQWNEAIREPVVKKSNRKYNFIYYSVSGGEEILSLAFNGKTEIGERVFLKLTAIMGGKGRDSLTNMYNLLVDANTGCIREFSYHDYRIGKEVIYKFDNYVINTSVNRRDIDLNLPSDVRITQIN